MITGTPIRYVIANLFITILITLAIFYPAIHSFGTTLIGTEDISLFLWIFWHYENTLDHGGNPLFAEEIFYPHGISLSRSSTTPFQSIIYWLLPDGWNAFGKITFLQMLSYILGGTFSFLLVFHFARSFYPSFFGSTLFNFSVYHFEKFIHHLNYAMAFPLLALFFLFYFITLKNKSRTNIIVLSFSLFILFLNEITVGLMASFIIFLDLIRRYSRYSGVALFTPKNALLFSFGIVASIIVYLFSFYLSLPPLVTYILPPIPFIFTCIYAIGLRNFYFAEKNKGFFRMLLLAAVPVFVFLVFIFIQPSYSFEPDNVPYNLFQFSTPLEYLIMPSDLQLISKFGFIEGLPVRSDLGVYLGFSVLTILILSLVIRGGSEEEIYFRDFFFISLLFSFPLLRIDQYFFAFTPFIAQTLFPMLPVLRVPSRFIIFSLLFLSIVAGLLIKRLLSYKSFNWKPIIAFITLLFFLEHWPATGLFVFDGSVPEFYNGLAERLNNESIFIYPNLNYEILLKELYYQTVHNKQISWGVISRSPTENNEFLGLYSIYYSNSSDPDNVADFITSSGHYNYIVVQKQTCFERCFYGEFDEYNQTEADKIRSVLSRRFGQPIFRDGKIEVYLIDGN